MQRKSIAGFTLLELMVVLVLLGAITGITLPNLVKLYDRIVARLALDSVLHQFEGVGRQAFLKRKNYVIVDSSLTEESFHYEYPELSQFSKFPLILESGWEIHVESPIKVMANGICLGGLFSLYYNGQETYSGRLEAPHCYAQS